MQHAVGRRGLVGLFVCTWRQRSRDQIPVCLLLLSNSTNNQTIFTTDMSINRSSKVEKERDGSVGREWRDGEGEQASASEMVTRERKSVRTCNLIKW